MLPTQEQGESLQRLEHPEPSEFERRTAVYFGHDPGEIDWGTFREVYGGALQIGGVSLGDAEEFALRVSTGSKEARPMDPAPQGPKVLQRDEYLALREAIAEAEARRLELLGLSEGEYDDVSEEYVNRCIALSNGYSYEAIDWDAYYEVWGALVQLDGIDPEFWDEAGELAFRVGARPAEEPHP